ncbi:MAG: hypothetical protein ACWA5A_17750 [Marinibacterium sp.]
MTIPVSGDGPVATKSLLWIAAILAGICGVAGLALYYGAGPDDIALIGFTAFGAVVLLFAATVVWQLVRREELRGIIQEPDASRKASLSRFQFLVFTFVVAGLFLMLSIESGTLVEIPTSVLTLIGLSGGTFVVSKAVTNAREPGTTGAAPAGEPPKAEGGGQ